MNIYELIDKMALEHKSIFDMPLRVTFYARVSTKSDEQLNSQENQIQTFTDLIKRNSNMTDTLVYELSKTLINKIVVDPKGDRMAEITIIPMFGNNVNIGINKQKIVMKYHI